MLGHGVDIVALGLFQKSFTNGGTHFRDRVFSQSEIDYCETKVDSKPHYAARFAAKEAYAKAIGLGLGAGGAMKEISVAHNEKGAPMIELTGRAKKVFAEKFSDSAKIYLSLSHHGDYASASVIIA